jgi:hypothetical protein
MTTFLSIGDLFPASGAVAVANFVEFFAMTGSLGAGRARDLRGTGVPSGSIAKKVRDAKVNWASLGSRQ